MHVGPMSGELDGWTQQMRTIAESSCLRISLISHSQPSMKVLTLSPPIFNTVYALEGTPLWRWTFARISRASHHTAKPGGIASIDLQTILQYLTLCVTTVMRP